MASVFPPTSAIQRDSSKVILEPLEPLLLTNKVRDERFTLISFLSLIIIGVTMWWGLIAWLIFR